MAGDMSRKFGGSPRSKSAFLPVRLSMRNDHVGISGTYGMPSTGGCIKNASGSLIILEVQSMMLTSATAPGGALKSFRALEAMTEWKLQIAIVV